MPDIVSKVVNYEYLDNGSISNKFQEADSKIKKGGNSKMP